MTCYEILTDKDPLDEYPKSRREVTLFGNLRPQLSDDVYLELVDLLYWHQDPDGRPRSAVVVVEIKCLVDSLECIYPIIARVFGLDEEYISTCSILDEDLIYFQNLLDADNEGSPAAEGFACGYEYDVSGRQVSTTIWFW